MGKKVNILNIFILLLGVTNVVLGLLLVLWIFSAQGFYLAFFGFTFVVFGISLFRKRCRRKLLYFCILPGSFLLSMQILGMIFSPDVPGYFRLPVVGGLVFLFVFWGILMANFFICKKLR